MLRTTLLSTAVLLTLSGCARISDSRLNPFNWFGNSTETTAVAPADRRPLVPEGRGAIVDSRPMVQTITALSIDRAPSGAIVRATGVAPTQGYFNAELVEVGISNGVLMLEFRAQAPTGFKAQGSARSREINAGYIIDTTTLAGIRSVRVQSATNARTSGR